MDKNNLNIKIRNLLFQLSSIAKEKDCKHGLPLHNFEYYTKLKNEILKFLNEVNKEI